MTVCSTIALLCLPAAAPAQGVAPTSTWGIVESVNGPYVTLDDGSVYRLRADTPVRKGDGSAGAAADILRGSKVVLDLDRHGVPVGVQVSAPRAVREVYLANLAPMRGAASALQVVVDGQIHARALAAVRTVYARPTTYTAFRTEVRYAPVPAPGAPGAVRFAVRDGLGTTLCERVVRAGETLRMGIGLDAQAGDRLLLEATPEGGGGELRQAWCLWLDACLQADTGVGPPQARLQAADRLVAALQQTGRIPLEARVAVAQFRFVHVREGNDNDAVRDLQDDLLTRLGRVFAAAGKLPKQLEVGIKPADADRDQLKQMGAGYVLIGTLSTRAEGNQLSGVIVDSATGAIAAGASVWE